MPLSMKDQGWKNNIVVVEGREGGERGGENVRNDEGWKGIYRGFTKKKKGCKKRLKKVDHCRKKKVEKNVE